MSDSSLGSWSHLARRFAGVMIARSLRPGEIEQIRAWLRSGEPELFFAQPSFDQRHGYQAARVVLARAPGRLDLIRAALLHDVGKRRAGLGPMGRSLASAWAKLGGGSRGSWARYLAHGEIAAAELEATGAEPIVVQFARSHHGPRPATIPEWDWELLQSADRG